MVFISSSSHYSVASVVDYVKTVAPRYYLLFKGTGSASIGISTSVIGIYISVARRCDYAGASYSSINSDGKSMPSFCNFASDLAKGLGLP